tara:strand:- start:72 stop:344 length:273 start_codon:yes stop_codon:yes gene_type:complete
VEASSKKMSQIQRLQAVIVEQAHQIQRLQAVIVEQAQHSVPAALDNLDNGFETWVRQLRQKEKAAENARLRKQYYHIQRKKKKMANSLYQ